jgi:hypothetical protein
MRTHIPVSVFVLALTTSGCGEEMRSMTYRYVPSTGVATSDLKATFQVSGEQGKDTIQAGAFFSNQRTGDGVHLEGNDLVTCDGVRLAGTYGASYATLPRKAPGERYAFELRRDGETISVAVTAIDAIRILAPTAATEIPLNQPLTVSWKASASTAIAAQLMGGCVVSDAKTDVESGSLVLDVTRLPEVPDNGEGESTIGYDPNNPNGEKSCVGDATLSLVRTRAATEQTVLAATTTIAEETHRVAVHIAKEGQSPSD